MIARLKGYRFLGLYWKFADEDCDGSGTYLVWPWRFGWVRSQMYETLFLGPCYLQWTWA